MYKFNLLLGKYSSISGKSSKEYFDFTIIVRYIFLQNSYKAEEFV